MVQVINFWVLSQRARQVQREEAQELTEKLDLDWKNIHSLMVKNTPKAEQVDRQEETPKVGTHQSISGMLLCFHHWQGLICPCSPPASSVGSSWTRTT